MYVLSELWWKDKFSKFHAKKIIAVIDNNIVLIVVLVLKGCRTTKFKTLGNKVNCFYCRDCCFLGKLWKHKISKLHTLPPDLEIRHTNECVLFYSYIGEALLLLRNK